MSSKIRPQINITETDISSYLSEKEKNPAHVEYQVAEIFLKNNDTNQQLATQIVSELRSGAKRFSVIAKQFSQGLEAIKGGLLGWIPEGRLEELDDALKTAPVGKSVIRSSRPAACIFYWSVRNVISFRPSKAASA